MKLQQYDIIHKMNPQTIRKISSPPNNNSPLHPNPLYFLNQPNYNSSSLIDADSRHNLSSITQQNQKQNLSYNEFNKASQCQQNRKEEQIDYESMFLIDTVSAKQKDNHRLFMTTILQNEKRAVIEVLGSKKCLQFVLKPEANQKDARTEIMELLRSHGILSYEARIMDMKYIFEIDEIPRDDVRVCEIRYPFGLATRTPSPACKGYTFTYIIGTKYNPLELFIIRNKIRGPQWIRVPKRCLEEKETQAQKNLIKYNLLESQCIDSQTLREKKVPLLKIMSLSLKVGRLSDMITQNKKLKENSKNQFVIYNLSYVFKSDYELHSKNNSDNIFQSQSYYLNEFGQPKLSENVKTIPKSVVNENLMLSHLMTRISVLQPDIIVCHDFNCSIDVLTSRLARHQNDNLRKFGRIYLGDYISANINPTKRINALLKGRIIVDTMKHADDAVKTGDRKLSTLSFILDLKPVPQLTYNDAVKMIKYCEFSSLFIHTYNQALNTFKILSELQILESTLELTNICGYLWQKVLSHNRAERNEYLIMHQCYKQKYLIPDKFFYHQEGYDGKYEGGMVIDPKRGLHIGFIVLLDFISLYPSIIREYNICFSKIKRNLMPISHYVPGIKQEEEKQKEEVVAVPPLMQYCTEQNWGMLPRLIHMLVTQREKYKKLMKLSTSQSQKSHYNTVQTAYKLVANSIYGCLGYQKSRFYSKDLASLITRLGRRSLQNALDVIQNFRENGEKHFEVIYGDTDSLMLKVKMQMKQDTVSTQLTKIIQTSNKVISDINSFYDIIKMQIDGIFYPIFLVSKKKYAGKKLSNLQQVLSLPNSTQPEFNTEYKGVETIRNDSSLLLKEVTSKLFQILLQPSKNISTIVSEIYDYFQHLSKEIELMEFGQYNKFVLRKTLNKDPHTYLKDKGMYHVLVAKDLLAQGHNLDSLINHMIEYVMVVGQTQNFVAVDVNSYIKSQGTLNQKKINKKYYKEKEILPVVERILEEIKEIDMDLFLEKFTGKSNKKKEPKIEREDEKEQIEQKNQKLQQIDIKMQALFGVLKCPKCSKSNKMTRNGVFVTQCYCLECQNNKPNFLVPHIINKIILYFYTFTSKYYSVSKTCLNCETQWNVDVKRCKCSNQQFESTKSSITFHQNLYLIRKVVELSLEKQPLMQQRYQPLLNHIDRILSSSKFQQIPARLFQRIKYNP